MTLEPGATLLHYRLGDKIGEGGMGVVWRATDTSLGREVAIKVLPASVAADPERLGRFEREARLLATLNHPNIAAVYGLHEVPGGDAGQRLRFIAMELVEGEDLAARLARGPLGLDDALRLCIQVAEALEAAHERGVIHRDLKPANIVLAAERSASGAPRAKVLDFGLAKALAGEIGGGSDPSHSPTVTSLGSVAGMILGTAAYMSPEQARGNPVDTRTDAWAFGCVLYEALTGRRAFAGSTVSDCLAAVLAREPDWSALPAATPPRVRALLRRLLDKDVARRPRDLGFARVELGDALRGEPGLDGAAPAVSAAAPVPAGIGRAVVWSAVAAAAVLGLLAGWLARPAPSAPPPLALRAGIEMQPGLRGLTSMAMTPDGQRLLITANEGASTALYVRGLDGESFGRLPGTENARDVFSSPDGKWAGFFADGRLKKVPLDGGTPAVLCDAPDARGGTWAPDGTIYFTPYYTSGLWRISASGGTAEQLTQPDPARRELSHRYADVLPGGKALIFTIELPGSFDNAQIGLLDLEDRSYRVLVENGTFPRYAATGHIVFGRERTLFAMPFDIERLEVQGPPAPILNELLDDVNSGTAAYSFSANGLLAYAPSTAVDNRRIVYVGRDGTRRTFAEQRAAYSSIDVSPDGRRLAATLQERSIWINDLDRGTLTRLSFKPADWFGVWTPDGQRVSYSSSRDGAFNLYWTRADGGGEDERLTESEDDQISGSWSPDGSTLLFWSVNAETGRNLWLLHVDGEPRTEPFLVTPYDETGGVFSPDGRWIAYTSNESGMWQIHVRPFPGPGGRWQVSNAGGDFAVWSRDGRELYYMASDGIWAVPVSAQPDFRAGSPRRVTAAASLADAVRFFGFALAPDGEGFLVIQQDDYGAPIRLVTNWFDDLRARSGAGR